MGAIYTRITRLIPFRLLARRVAEYGMATKRLHTGS